LDKVAHKYVLTSDQLAWAMLDIAVRGNPKRILDSADLVRLAESPG